MENVKDAHPVLTIGVLGDSPIQPAFEALVADACESIPSALDDLLDGLYLYGSVARGCAVPGQSDLDMTLVLTRQPSAQERERIEALRRDLEARHREVAKIDFDIGVRADVLDPANLYSWGYWLKHECRCLQGNDLSQRFDAFIPSRAIAEGVNGDYVHVLNDYAHRIASASDPATAHRLMKEAARKLIRSTNILRAASDSFWPLTLEAHASRFSAGYPDMADKLGFFLTQARAPQASATTFNANLSSVVDWMEREHRRLSTAD
ncbi:DNA polymerase subunit beta [Pandoraea iniqua]|uniref:DNA polymerase subunit beta n=1 Tax=Pandoraea iniqua TaxID=2508288 RepID=A0A5E4X062_9BURK|nr:nucleotidyltransferase domain-containing protein [Pandoraea iniqua]VVE29653.1 DNA polymerase subunit beta [Pandoraea iniqua]